MCVQQMNHLVSLVLCDVQDPKTVGILIPKFRSLQKLELYTSNISGDSSISALKNVNTLERLTINQGLANGIEMATLFDAYAIAPMGIRIATTISEQRQNMIDECIQQQNGLQKLAHVSLIGCEFLQGSTLETLGNIKTLSSVSIRYGRWITSQGINAFCEQLNLLPELSSITLSGVSCVDNSTLSILGASLISAICSK